MTRRDLILNLIGVYELVGAAAGVTLLSWLQLSAPTEMPFRTLAASAVPFLALGVGGLGLVVGWAGGRTISMWCQAAQAVQTASSMGVWKFCAGPYVVVALSGARVKSGLGVDVSLVAGPGSMALLPQHALNLVALAVLVSLAFLTAHWKGRVTVATSSGNVDADAQGT